MKRYVARRPEPRIVDPATHPKKWVNLTVAAEFLEMDRRALNLYIADGQAHAELKGRRLRMHVTEVARFKAWLRQQAPRSA